jgi:hypothetical protein
MNAPLSVCTKGEQHYITFFWPEVCQEQKSVVHFQWYKVTGDKMLIHQQQPEINQQSTTEWHSTETPLQWDTLGPVETSHVNKMPTNRNEGCCTVVWQCPSMHYHPHCWHPPVNKLQGVAAFCIQSWAGPFRLSHVWSTQECLKRTPIY